MSLPSDNPAGLDHESDFTSLEGDFPLKKIPSPSIPPPSKLNITNSDMKENNSKSDIDFPSSPSSDFHGFR